jgi:hypothetical protein
MPKLPHQSTLPPVDGQDAVNKNFIGPTDALITASGTVTISGSLAPTVGQALVAISPTVAEWSDVAATGGGGGSAGDYIHAAAQGAQQTWTDITVRLSDIITQRGDITVDANGRFSGLKAGHTYLLSGTIAAQDTATFNSNFWWYDVTGAVGLGSISRVVSTQSALYHHNTQSRHTYVFTPLVDSEIELQTFGGDEGSPDIVTNARTSATIVEIGAVAGIPPNAQGVDTIRIGSNTSHDSDTPLLVGQFELDPGDYPATAVYTLRAVGANGSTPLTTHLRLYNLTDNEQVDVLDFVDTLNPVLVTSQMSTGTASGTLRTTATLYEAQVFVDSPVTGADTIELGSAEIRVTYPILSDGVDTIRFDMAKSYASSTPFAVGQFELNVDDYPGTAVFSLRAIAANSVATQTSHVTLYNITNSEDVADLSFTNNVTVELQQAALTTGTTSGTLRSSSVIYEARIYIEPTISGTMEFGSAEIRVNY